MITISYVSDNRISGDLGEIVRLRDCAAENNERLGLTGCLYFDSDYFFQILEGPAAKLFARMRRIWVDPRHRNVHVIDVHDINKRRFTAWQLKLVNGVANPNFAHQFIREGLMYSDRGYLAARVQDLVEV